MRLDEFLSHFEGVKGGEGQWYARCPAHDDHEASLSIGIGAEGKRLLMCWAGCELGDILRGARLAMTDLFETRDERALGKPWGDRPLNEVVLPLDDELDRAVDRLMNDEEALAYIADRKGWDKLKLWALGVGKIGDRFAIPVREWSPEGKGKLVNVLKYKPDAPRKVLALPGRPRTPVYFITGSGPLFLVEGETDAVSMAMLGFDVIGAPGASTKPRVEWLEPIRGRDVIVCMDVDEAGRRAARRWAQFAFNRGATSVRVLVLEGPEKYDVGDMVRAGGLDHATTRRAMLELVAEATPYDPSQGVEKLPPEPAELGGDPELNGEHPAPGTILLHGLAGFRMRRLNMLWRDRIPVGRVGIIFGPPGLGKSTLLAMIMSDVVRDGGRVIIASAEDDPETTLKPRLVAAGADPHRVDLIATAASKGETGLVLPRDLDELGTTMRGTSLLIIDPLPAHLGEDCNSWREQDVRALVLAPLAWHSRITGCTVVLIMHINKSAGTDPLSRISGSGGFGGAARFALLLGAHPDDLALDEAQQRLALVHVKASETIKRRAMVFRRVERYFELGGGEMVETSTLELLDDDARITAEAVLQATDPDEAGAYSEAMAFLRHELGDGPKLAKRLLAVCRERGDFSDRTLRKAKRAMGVTSEKDTEGWWWAWNRT